MTIPRRASRRAYNRVTSSSGGSDRDRDGGLSSSSSRSRSGTSGALSEPLSPNEEDPNQEGGLVPAADAEGSAAPPTAVAPPPPGLPPIRNPVQITVLDSAHSKFAVTADSDWTVSQFKAAGTSAHRVPAASQRLIYMGRLLDDDDALADYPGLTEGGKIVHLFPKPKINLTGTGEAGGSGANTAADGTDRDGEGDGDGDGGRGGTVDDADGAHVPQIYLDPTEASSILVLSSQEIFESMHRVKLLSFLLLIMSSMELLTLFSIMLGGVPETDGGGGGGAGGYGGYDDIPPGDPTDTSPNFGPSGGGGGGEVHMRTWRSSDYADLAVSAVGFYVATLGIKATTESTVGLARRYFLGLILAGLGWNAYQYYLNVQVYKDAEEAAEAAAEDGEDGSSGGGGGGGGGIGPSEGPDVTAFGDPYSAAAGTMAIPLAIWGVCWFRAWEFQHLMREAESEAEERTRSLTGAGANAGDEEEGGGGMERGAEGGGVGGVDDLELRVQVDNRTIT